MRVLLQDAFIWQFDHFHFPFPVFISTVSTSPYKSCLLQLYLTVVPEQGLVAAATSCVRVFSSCQSCYEQILMPKRRIQLPK